MCDGDLQLSGGRVYDHWWLRNSHKGGSEDYKNINLPYGWAGGLCSLWPLWYWRLLGKICMFAQWTICVDIQNDKPNKKKYTTTNNTSITWQCDVAVARYGLVTLYGRKGYHFFKLIHWNRIQSSTLQILGMNL